MSKIEDLTNNKYGKLTVKKFYKRENHKTYWLCDCDCGTKNFIAQSYLLKKGKTTSCGCNYRKRINTIEVGFVKGFLTVKEILKENNITKFKCECQCGNIVYITSSQLLHKTYNSCGCMRYVKRNKKINNYNITGSYGIGYINEIEFYFDLEDYDKIKNYCWYLGKKGYIETTIINKNKKKKHLKLHRLIMNETNSKIHIDHISHNKLDNRKNNLRKCSQQNNNKNTKKSIKNKSGYIGVRYDDRRNKWYASLTINKQYIFLGYYENKEDAIIARLKGEKKYFKEYAPQKHLFKKYNII